MRWFPWLRRASKQVDPAPYGLTDSPTGARGPMWSSEATRWLPTVHPASLVRPYVNAGEQEQVRRHGWWRA